MSTPCQYLQPLRGALSVAALLVAALFAVTPVAYADSDGGNDLGGKAIIASADDEGYRGGTIPVL